ncbi:lipocalin-like domain-containing protein [Thalassococcus sp. BH17M4-6]|uniref:lipocalin-like domain-containing protein n=1 Tax=Thalassococcus sp. BH17M4-6 TaxID=3413148 RepID=UPI003BC2C247
MNVKALLVSALLTLAPPVLAQGFAGLGSESDGFAVPQAGTALEFPRDHLPHPAYRIEWWYLTANLTGPDGTPYGAQWTLFRSALRPEDGVGWDTPQLWMGHAAVTTPDAHHVGERLARGGIGQAGVTAGPFEAYIDDWALRSIATVGDPLGGLAVTARGADFAYDLTLNATGPLLLQGDAGYSVKSPEGQASYYYSQPGYAVTGTLSLPGGPVEVTGQAWLDREWSSQPLAQDQTGWDWFSLHFASGAKLMGFGLRSRDGGHFTSATWVAADGTVTAYGDGALQMEPLETATVAGREVPVAWRLRLPAQGVSVETQAVNPQSWMDTLFPYWEGPIRFSGSHEGRGYLEMTGYD